eukprot:5875737-Alexandrium_andersonii.AAC.1
MPFGFARSPRNLWVLARENPTDTSAGRNSDASKASISRRSARPCHRAPTTGTPLPRRPTRAPTSGAATRLSAGPPPSPPTTRCNLDRGEADCHSSRPLPQSRKALHDIHRSRHLDDYLGVWSK